jgi:hypothetical protein
MLGSVICGFSHSQSLPVLTNNSVGEITDIDTVYGFMYFYIFAGVSANSIAVQSPYMAQVQLLCDRIEAIPGTEGIEVASIDSFQGREADAVVISMVYLLSCHLTP